MSQRIFHIVYLIMVITVVGIVGWALLQYDGSSQVDYCFGEKVDFSAGWTLDNGIVVDTSRLRDIEEIGTYEEFSIFNQLPDSIGEGQYLCFRSKNIFFSVYFGDELVYEPYVEENKVYTNSYGTQWHYIPVKQQDVGKEIEIKIVKVYEAGRSSVDNLYIGESAKVGFDMIKEKMVAFLTCIIILFAGLVLIVADIPINFRKEKNHELLYMGLFSINVAIWCLAETHLLQLFIVDSRTMQLVSCCSLMLMCIPLILYLDSAFGFKKRGVVWGLMAASAISFVVVMVLHFAEIADVHETLIFIHIVLFLCAITVICVMIKNIFFVRKISLNNIYSVLRLVGLSGISIATAIDIYRYYCKTGNDTAMFVRIGLLIFIICFGVSSLEKTINAVKLSIQTEFVSQLAYRDGLTQIGNRTSFEERLKTLDEEKEQIGQVGVVMFDVNDLKYVNDNFGHHKGDSMLIQSARFIQEAFETVQGESFRLGGDEFVVLLSGDDVMTRYDTGIKAFMDNMKEYNAKLSKDSHINIAYGFAIYDKEQQESSLHNIYKQADKLMYENKKKMKQNQSIQQE